jgi:hypothetical protein
MRRAFRPTTSPQAALVAALVAGVLSGLVLTAATATAKRKVATCDGRIGALIGASFDQFLSGATTAARVKFVHHGARIAPFVDQAAATPTADAAAAPGTKVVAVALAGTCDGPRAATFVYDLGRIGTSSPPPTASRGAPYVGDAVLDAKRGAWLITPETACDLLHIQGAPTDAGCYAAIGLTPPAAG